MARNHASARPAQRKGSSSVNSRGSARAQKKIVQSSAPRASMPAPAPKPEPVKRTGELPIPRATYFL
jgi:hypothetical protein